MSWIPISVIELADTGFPAVAGVDARILVLGSMPGQRSLRKRQYYAHPQNAFWRIMDELVGATGPYDQRCNALVRHGIALWDVLLSSDRPGSMDADIRLDHLEPNDFEEFFHRYSGIVRVGFNGQTAARLFDKLVAPDVQDRITQTVVLPSTSPAYASMPFVEKLERWRAFITN